MTSTRRVPVWKAQRIARVNTMKVTLMGWSVTGPSQEGDEYLAQAVIALDKWLKHQDAA